MSTPTRVSRFPRHFHADLGARAVDYELHGCPIDREQLLEYSSPSSPGAVRSLPRIRSAKSARPRHRLSVGLARGTVSRPGDEGRVRSIVSFDHRGCFGCFGRATALTVTHSRHDEGSRNVGVLGARLFGTFNTARPVSPSRPSRSGQRGHRGHPTPTPRGAATMTTCRSSRTISAEGISP